MWDLRAKLKASAGRLLCMAVLDESLFHWQTKCTFKAPFHCGQVLTMHYHTFFFFLFVFFEQLFLLWTRDINIKNSQSIYFLFFVRALLLTMETVKIFLESRNVYDTPFTMGLKYLCIVVLACKISFGQSFDFHRYSQT